MLITQVVLYTQINLFIRAKCTYKYNARVHKFGKLLLMTKIILMIKMISIQNLGIIIEVIIDNKLNTERVKWN